MKMKLLNFKDFLNEKLSYSDEVEDITNYILNHLKNKKEWDYVEKIHIKSNTIKEVIVEFIDDLVSKNGKYGSFNQFKSDFKNKSIHIEMDPDYLSEEMFNHEIFHGYEWIKKGGNELISPFEMGIISAKDYFKENETILKIIHLFYILSDVEIRSHYNQDVYSIKNYKKSNKVENLDELYKETELYDNYEFIKNFNLKEEFNNLSDEEIDEFISIVDSLTEMENGEEKDVELNNYSNEERQKFLNKLEKLYKKQKERYIKYLGKLKLLF
jgi:hypothetical protein